MPETTTNSPVLTHDEALRLFRYEPETGLLFWRVPKGKGGKHRDLTKPIGHKAKACYINVIVNGKSYLVHRLIWFMAYGEWPKHTIDHIDRDMFNNRLENLRDVTRRVQWLNSANFDAFKARNPRDANLNLYKT